MYTYHGYIRLLGVINGNSDDVEVIFLPTRGSGYHDEMPFVVTAFGRKLELNLQKNHKLLAPSFQVWRHDRSNVIEPLPDLGLSSSCNYLHTDGSTTAAISLCEEDVINGLILMDNSALEITPLREQKKSRNFLNNPFFINDNKTSELPQHQPHLIKRSYISSMIPINDSQIHDSSNIYKNLAKQLLTKNEQSSRSIRNDESIDLTIELAVFFDEAGYKLFAPHFNNDDKKIFDMLLAYVNGVQAVFYHPSLGARIDVVLVRMDIMKRQPTDLRHWNGERERLLNSFCSYARLNNLPNDDDPGHWDMAVYLSGLDFWADEDGSSVTMGLAPVNGTCYAPWSCVIAELGVNNRFGKPYPSAGFTSVYIAAHEMGHNLGMRHDSVENTCTKDGFIMSPSRGTQGETMWSPCSRDVALKLHNLKPCLLDKPTPSNDHRLDHSSLYSELPGRSWTSKKQCEILLRDKDATVVTLSNACNELRCKTPNRIGYFMAGPALDGTMCDEDKECRGGHCSPIDRFPGEDPKIDEKIGWSEWIEEACSSGCVEKSKGAKSRRRECRDEQIQNGRRSSCAGLARDVVLCTDENLCDDKRLTAIEFANYRCRNFSNYVEQLDDNGGGLQAAHEVERLWMGCAVFCKRRDTNIYYTPRIELYDLGLDPYYPDGTWCHSENGDDYYCRRHHCLPERFRFGKDSWHREKNLDDDEDSWIVGTRNGEPRRDEGDDKMADELVRYLSLGADGLPLSRKLPTRPDVPNDYEDALIDRDYFEISRLGYHDDLETQDSNVVS